MKQHNYTQKLKEVRTKAKRILKKMNKNLDFFPKDSPEYSALESLRSLVEDIEFEIKQEQNKYEKNSN